MSDAAERHQAQIEAWNGPMGAQWAANEARTERTLVPVTEALLRAAAARPGETVLDVGCGCGGSSLAFARAVGPDGRVIGVDVSAPMLEVARGTAAANTEYVLADAAAHDFAPGSVDLLTSRFGVMFFGDPGTAFARLRRAMRPGGRLAFACWRPLADNPWVNVPLAAVAPLVPPMPRPGPDDPGPFAFGDANRVARILGAAGFGPVRFETFDFAMRFRGDPAKAAEAVALVGPASRALRGQSDEVRAQALAAIAAAIAPHAVEGEIRLGGAVWLVTAPAA